MTRGPASVLLWLNALKMVVFGNLYSLFPNTIIVNILLLQIRINSNIKFDIRNIWQRKGDVAFRGVPNNFEWIFILSGGKRPQHQM